MPQAVAKEVHVQYKMVLSVSQLCGIAIPLVCRCRWISTHSEVGWVL